MSLNSQLPLFVLAVAYNLMVFGIYAWDKQAARNGDWRVKESTLLFLAFAGGGAGALAAQRLLRHKTRKPPFPIALPLFFILQIGGFIVAIAASDRAIAVLDKLGLN